MSMEKALALAALAKAGQGGGDVSFATDAEVKAGTESDKALAPSNESAASFYGLAKAAGDNTQAASSNPVGTYTAEAKTAIKSMLGVSGGGETWELINEIVLSEDTNLIQFDKDSNGNSFSCKKLAAHISATGYSENTGGTLYCGVTNTTHELDLGNTMRATDTTSAICFESVGSEYMIKRFASLATAISTIGNRVSTQPSSAYLLFSYIRFYCATPNKFGAGTTIKLYGVRA